MELPPFHPHHNHHRYVTPPPPSENPNFYHPYSHRLPPPPPPPPPQQQQQQLRPPPIPPLPPTIYHLSRPHLPPPSPPPPQSQFSFRPHIEERRFPVPAPAPTPAPAAGQVSNFIPPHLLNQPRSLSPHRVPSQYHHGHPNPTFYGENSPVLNPWPELSPLPRAPIEPDFRYQHQRRPLSPLPSRLDNYMNEFEHSVRFRDELIKEGFRDGGNPELLLWGRQKERDFGVRDEVDDDKYRYCNGYDEFGINLNSGFERNIDRINRDFVSADSQCNNIGLISSRDFALNVGNYESCNDIGNYKSYNDRGEDLTWGYSRLENHNKYMDGEGIPLPSHGMRHELLDGGCDDVDRLSIDRLGEGVQEFLSRSPRKKQVQKKSALLRIQFGKGNNRNNNRNRSHDNSWYSRSHYEESSLSAGGSFKGKGKNVSVHTDWKMEEQREKSPVELDVSFKSNALIAKAIKTTSSLVVESDWNLAPGNRKLKKTNVANYPGNQLCDDSVKFAGSTHVLDSSSVADNEHRESTKKIISSKTASSVAGLDRPSSSNICSKEPAENTVTTRSDGRVSEFDSGSDKESGPLAEKMSVCDSKTDAVDGNIAGEESVNLIGSHQAVKRVAPGGVLKQITKKRKTVESVLPNGAALQSMSALCEPTSPGDYSTCSLSAGSQLDESITHSKDGTSSASIREKHDSLSLALANTFEKLNNASENVVSDLKEGCVSISSSLPLPPECSALKSVSLIPGDADAVHANRLVHNGLSRLNTDTGLAESQYTSVTSGIRDLDDANEHPCLDGSLLVENDPIMKATVSAESNAGLSLSRLKENKFHDSQIHTSTSKHDPCTASTSDKGSCRKPGDIIVADTGNVNADSKEFLLDQDCVSHENNIAKDSPNPDLSVSGICRSSKIEETSIWGSVETRDLSGNVSSSPKCYTQFFTDSLGNKTVSDICSLEDSFKQAAVDGATTLLVKPPGERSPKSMDSHSSGIGKKRKNKNDQLGVHGKKTSKIAGSMVSALDDDGRCSSLLANELVSVEEEVDCRNGVKTIGRDCLEGGLPEFNPSLQGGKERKDFPFISTSSVLSEIGQGPKDSIIANPSTDCLQNSEEGTNTQPEDRVAFSSLHNDAFAGLTAYSDASVPQLQGNNIAGESYQSLGGGTKGQCSRIDHGMSCPPKWEADNKDNTALAISDSDIQISEDTISGDGKNNLVRPGKNQKQQFGNGDCENHLLLKENPAVPSNDVPSCADVCGISASSSTDQQINSVPDTLSNAGSPEDIISNLRSDVLDNESRLSQISYKYNGNDGISNKNAISGGDMRALPLVPSSQSSDTGTGSGYAISMDLVVKTKAASLLPRNTSRVIPDSYPKLMSPLTNNRQKFSVVGNFPGHTSIKYPYKAKVSASNCVAKPRTWHRTLKSSPSVVGPKPPGNCIHPQISSEKEVANFQSSYVRRGNSLVRKPPPVGATPQLLHASRPSVHHLNSGIDNVRKGSEQKIDIADSPISATFSTSNSCPGRPKTPPLMDNVKLLNCTAPVPEDLIFPLLPDPPRNDVETNGPPKSAEDMDKLRSSEADLKSFGVNGCQTDSTKDLECQSNADERNSGKQILYVKRKSNQLVAASNRDDLYLHPAESTQMLFSDGYYKRKKNQLIWTSLNEGGKQNGVVSDKILSSRQKDAQNNIQSTSSSKRQSGFMKKKYSLVWTLHDTLSSRKNVTAVRWRRLLPYLFPWKRAMHCTNFMHRLSAIPNGPVSTIGQKLLLSRKRDAIYKRSINGFSLRRSKVFSVGGCSLKWSKSIERNSRKANEDATLAVVAAEKRKRAAKDGAAVTLSRSRNYVSRRSGYSIKLCPGERIFRIGSERYRMDPTRKTLQRISDERPSNSDDQLEKNRKKFYVPRRLLIGSDEYIRIGNGNQLVRDPKRRTRILANEKVRWSLHTARLRLARKKKYCQFFTRFGKCNKDDKRCPYIHDPSKIAVCTKFLNGACSNPDCKLTHRVIPERMQDCSYFLQGLCSNESCPYRHVNVNPNSPICEGFLRGYCADGNECRKKHTYVCPVFEATGNCPQGPKCKLHHPKMKKKGMKRKTLNLQKNARGRYFGTRPVDFADCRAVVSGVICGKGDNSSFDENSKFADFISLDVNIEEMEHAFELRSESICDGEGPSDMELDVPDELIKPIRLMNKNLIIASSSPAVESSSEMTKSYVSEESLCG